MSSGKVDNKSKALHITLPDSAATCSHHYVVGGNVTPGSATAVKRSKFKKIKNETTEHLELLDSIYVTDGSAGANPKMATLVRCISDSAETALFFEHILCRMKSDVQTIAQMQPNRVKVYAASKLSSKFHEGNAAIVDADAGVVLVVGQPSTAAILQAVEGAIVGQAASAQNLTLIGPAVFVGSDVTVAVGGPAGVFSGASGSTWHGSIWGSAGLTPMFEGQTTSDIASASAFSLVEKIGASSVRVTQRSTSPPPNTMAAPKSVAIVSADPDTPKIAKLTPEQAGFYYLFLANCGTAGSAAGGLQAATLLTTKLGTSDTSAYLVNASSAQASLKSLVDGSASASALSVGSNLAKKLKDASAKYASVEGAETILAGCP
jgi:hypothetical protein